MWLIERFFRSETRFTERVSVDNTAKDTDFLHQTKACISSGTYPVTTYHFQNNLATILAILEGGGVSYERVSDFDLIRNADVADWRKRAQTLVLDSALIPDCVGQEEPPYHRSSAGQIRVNVFEHYPIPVRDQRVKDLIRLLPLRIELFAFSSMDEPLLRMFGGDRVKAFLELGMEKGECLSHPFLARSILKAQKKLEQTAAGEVVADSSENWFKLNLAQGGVASRSSRKAELARNSPR